MKTFITIIAAMMFSLSTLVGQEFTTIKSFPIDNATAAIVELDGPIVIHKWKENFIRVQTDIFDCNIGTSLLKNLVSSGYFNLALKNDNGFHILHYPNKYKEITISGKPFKYQTRYTIYVPEKLIFEINQTETPQNSL